MNTETVVADRRKRVARLERLANALDARFRLPGIGVRVGWDSILGLIPGVGDIITAAPAAVMMYEAKRMGARKRAIARMGVNTGIDLVVGGVPILGDAFDVFFKAHRKNVAILKSELDRIERRGSVSEKDRVDAEQQQGSLHTSER